MSYYMNYALMKSLDFISPRLLFGAVGYYEKQLTENQLDDHDMTDSKEQVFAIGLGIHYMTKVGVTLNLYCYFESAVENWTQGTILICPTIVFRMG